MLEQKRDQKIVDLATDKEGQKLNNLCKLHSVNLKKNAYIPKGKNDPDYYEININYQNILNQEFTSKIILTSIDDKIEVIKHT